MAGHGSWLFALSFVLVCLSNAFAVRTELEEFSIPIFKYREGLALAKPEVNFDTLGASAGIATFPPTPLMPIPNARQASYF
jgi:hypothetical protein